MCLTQNKNDPPSTVVVSIDEPVTFTADLLAEFPLTANSRIGNYQLIERIGSGGMGEVFRAVHVWLGREVAIKRIRPEKLYLSDAVNSFLDEVRTAALVDNPFVIRAYDAGTEGDYHYLVMELVDGIDLRSLVEANGSLSEYETLRVAAEVAMGLAHLEKLGLVHRDIKPTNLIRSRKTGSVKLLDLGLARRKSPLFEQDRGTRFTTGRELLGTPDFMAPEQAIDSRSVDIRSDFYSLGCTLYYLLSGQVPFPGGSLVRKVLCHYSEKPLQLSGLRPDVKPEVIDIVERLMAKNPSDRFQSPQELLENVGPLLIEAMADQSRLNRVETQWDFWLQQIALSNTPQNRRDHPVNAR